MIANGGKCVAGALFDIPPVVVKVQAGAVVDEVERLVPPQQGLRAVRSTLDS
jgi:hypothetical protein